MILQPGVKQFEAYTGTISPPFPEGDYLQVQVYGATETWNAKLWQLWDKIGKEIQSLSVSPGAMTSEITKDIVMQALYSINKCFVSAFQKVRTHANDTFDSTYGGPTGRRYEPYPIRWPGENRMALEVVLKYVSALFQIPQVRSNVLDNGIIENHASIILKPLYFCKSWIMREYFGCEIKGEISADELDAVFRDSNLMPPLLASLSDKHDTVADLAKEDELALSEESAHVPTVETWEQINAGKDVWVWVPTQQHMATLGEVLRRMETTGPIQVPGEPFPFPTNGVGGGGGDSSSPSGGVRVTRG